MRVLAAAVLVGLTAACGPHGGSSDDDGVPAIDAGPDAGPAPFEGDVYAHSYQRLYRVDPDTLQVTLVGNFGWPEGFEQELMTDIAVDRDGHITGISFGAVYAIDKDTAACTLLSRLLGEFNGLTFLPRVDGTEVLIGTGVGGGIWKIDPAGVAPSVQLGDYGGDVISSGDIVSVTGFGTVATVKNGSELDYLARIDEVTGAATIIGPTGYADIWGIGYWRDKVFGFVATNQFVLIDVDTGAATLISTGSENWAGAGVTTRAPIEP